MSRINTNVQSLISTRLFNKNSAELNVALNRLSTGLRINSGKDDPAGLIASEILRSAKVALTAATDNARRADTIVSVTEGALQEVNALLLDLEDLVDRTANEGGLSSAEIKANQLQIDSILSSINRLANSTSFGDKKLLQGNLDFTTSAVTTADLAAVDVNSARIADNSFRNVVIDVVTGSDFAFISAYGGDFGGAAGVNGRLSAALTIQVGGNIGTEVFSFASGTTQAQIVTAINAVSQLTGVSAITSSNAGGANAVIFSSNTFGSNAFVTVSVVSDSGANGLSLSTTSDTGTDGTITINGQAATVDGLEVSVRTGALSLDLTLTQTFGTTDAGSSSFQITGGGAKFNIAPQVGLVGQETIGVKNVGTGSLGNSALGFLSTLGKGEVNDLVSSNLATAQSIVGKAIDQVSSLRGRLGAFQRNTLGSAINSMLITFENVAAAESAIRDADFAVETSNLTRSQILVAASTTVLQIANAQPQNALSLLG